MADTEQQLREALGKIIAQIKPFLDNEMDAGGTICKMGIIAEAALALPSQRPDDAVDDIQLLYLREDIADRFNQMPHPYEIADAVMVIVRPYLRAKPDANNRCEHGVWLGDRCEQCVARPDAGLAHTFTRGELEELATEIRKAVYPSRPFTHNESELCAKAALNYFIGRQHKSDAGLVTDAEIDLKTHINAAFHRMEDATDTWHNDTDTERFIGELLAYMRPYLETAPDAGVVNAMKLEAALAKALTPYTNSYELKDCVDDVLAAIARQHTCAGAGKGVVAHLNRAVGRVQDFLDNKMGPDGTISLMEDDIKAAIAALAQGKASDGM